MPRDPLSPGSTSSEFRLTVLTMIIFVLNGTEYVNIPWEHIVWLAGLAGLGYGGRTLLKKTAIEVNGHKANGDAGALGHRLTGNQSPSGGGTP